MLRQEKNPHDIPYHGGIYFKARCLACLVGNCLAFFMYFACRIANFLISLYRDVGGGIVVDFDVMPCASDAARRIYERRRDF